MCAENKSGTYIHIYIHALSRLIAKKKECKKWRGKEERFSGEESEKFLIDFG